MSSSGTHHGSGQPAGLQLTGEPSPPDVLPWASEFSSCLALTAQQLPGSQVSLITLFLETFSFPASLASLSLLLGLLLHISPSNVDVLQAPS